MDTISPNEALILKVTSVTGKVTMFMKLKDLFPECEILIEKDDQLFPLRCLYNDGCHRNMTCMVSLAKRVRYVFDTFADVHLLMLYFRYRDRPGSHRAGVFYRDGSFPHFLTFNRASWEKFKKLGSVYKWRVPDSIFLQSKTA